MVSIYVIVLANNEFPASCAFKLLLQHSVMVIYYHSFNGTHVMQRALISTNQPTLWQRQKRGKAKRQRNRNYNTPVDNLLQDYRLLV